MRTLLGREYSFIYRGPAFLLSNDLATPPPPPPSSVSKLDLVHKKAEKEIQCADGRRGRGVGGEPNQTTARKSGPL
jgi:hypothetical protein